MRVFRIHEHGGLERLIDEEAPISTPTISDALIHVYGDVTPTELDWPSLWAILAHEVSGLVPALGWPTTGGDALYGSTDRYGDGGARAVLRVVDGGGGARLR